MHRPVKMTTESTTSGLSLTLTHTNVSDPKGAASDSLLKQEQISCMHESDSGIFLTPQSQVPQSLTCDSLVTSEEQPENNGKEAPACTSVSGQPLLSSPTLDSNITGSPQHPVCPGPGDATAACFSATGQSASNSSGDTIRQTYKNLRPQDGEGVQSSEDYQSVRGSVLNDTFMVKTKYVVLQFLHQTAAEQNAVRRSQMSLCSLSESEHHLGAKSPVVRQRCLENKSHSLPSSPGGSKPRPLAKTKDNKSSPDLKDAHFFRDTPASRLAKRRLPIVSPVLHSRTLHNVQTRGLLRSISQNTDSSEPSTYNSDADDELDSSFDSSQHGSVTSISLRSRVTNVHAERLPTLPSEAELGVLSGLELSAELDSKGVENRARAVGFVSPDMIVLEDKPPAACGTEHDGICQEHRIQDRLFHIGDMDGSDCTDGLPTTPQEQSDGGTGVPHRTRAMQQDSDATEVGELREPGEEGAWGPLDVGSSSGGHRVDRSKLVLSLRDDQLASSLTNPLGDFCRELDEEISSFESELDDVLEGQQKVLSSSSSTSQSLDHRSLTPETEAARLLMAIGDDIERRYHNDLRRAARDIVSDLLAGVFTYENFREAASTVLQHNLEGWQQVAALMLYGQYVALQLVQMGRRRLNFVVDYTVKLLAEKAADFIIQQGGWASLSASDPSTTSSSSEEARAVDHAHAAQAVTLDSSRHLQLSSMMSGISASKVQADKKDLQNSLDVTGIDGHQPVEADQRPAPHGRNRHEKPQSSSKQHQLVCEGAVGETSSEGESMNREVTPAEPLVVAGVIPGGEVANEVKAEENSQPSVSEAVSHSHLLTACAGFISFVAVGTAIVLNLLRS